MPSDPHGLSLAPPLLLSRAQKATVPSGYLVPEGGSAAVPTEAWHKQAKALHKVSTEVETLPVEELPDCMPMFEWAGVGLSKEETYSTYLAMLALKKKHSLLAVRFFGKILGTKADYVVIEGRAAADVHKPPSTPGAVPPESPGVGLNTFCYFVAPSAAEPFTLLEDVTPEQVVASQGIRKYFTGNLSAPVQCYPAFPGPESAYLRAQIARIVAATMVWPAGKFAFDEESEASPKPIVDNAEYAVPEDLSALDSWVHVYGKILKIGRTTNPPKPEAEGDEDAGDAEEQEEETPALEPIAADAAVMTFSEESELGAWTVTMHNNLYPAFGVAIAKSNRWPGAFAAISKTGDKSACVYIGHGHENAGAAFTPPPPPPILAESTEVDEAAEPALADENELLKEIDEKKLLAANAEGDAEAES
jgi:radial spoke head protein 4A